MSEDTSAHVDIGSDSSAPEGHCGGGDSQPLPAGGSPPALLCHDQVGRAPRHAPVRLRRCSPRSASRKHCDALRDQDEHPVVLEHRDEHIFSMIARGGNELLARRKTHTHTKSPQRKLDDLARPTVSYRRTKKQPQWSCRDITMETNLLYSTNTLHLPSPS